MAKEEGEEEDIVDRLEALRKRTPRKEPEKEEPPEREPPSPPQPEEGGGRKRIYRIVGLGVIALIIIGIFFAGYTQIIKPIQQKEALEEAQQEKAAQMLAQGKDLLKKKIRGAFSGLPESYRGEVPGLLNEVEMAQSIDDLKAIDYEGSASRAWRSYTEDLIEDKADVAGKDNVVLNVGNQSFKGYRDALSALSSFNYPQLKGATIEEIENIYVPIKLPREQAAGGLMMPGDYVNIYFTEGNTSILAKDAKVVTYLRATSSISLSESERRVTSGQGGEAKGEGSISSGGVSSLSGPISIGVRKSSTSTSYSVDISEVEKAAAASKLEKDYIERVLSNYGIKLTQIEVDSQVGNFDEEYILLLKLSEDEGEALISKATSPDKRKKLHLAISRPSSWMEE